jgi:hypothetical protein
LGSVAATVEKKLSEDVTVSYDGIEKKKRIVKDTSAEFEDHTFEVLTPIRLSNDFCAVVVHYSVHPDRQGEDYLKNATQGMSQEKIAQEFDCDFLGKGQRIFPYECLFDEDRHPLLTAVRTPPIEGHRYVLGGDAAEGSGDFCSGICLDVDTWSEVNSIYGRMTPKEFAKRLNSMGRRYNNAKVAVEDDKYGYATNIKLQEAHYPNLYKREVDRRVKDRLSGRSIKKVRKIGWDTNRKTKVHMITELAEVLIDESIGIASARILEEMNTFIQHDDGTIGAASGYHDDTVIALAIAFQLLQKQGPSLDRINETAVVAEDLSTMNTPMESVGDIIGVRISSIGESIPRLVDENEIISTKADW